MIQNYSSINRSIDVWAHQYLLSLSCIRPSLICFTAANRYLINGIFRFVILISSSSKLASPDGVDWKRGRKWRKKRRIDDEYRSEVLSLDQFSFCRCFFPKLSPIKLIDEEINEKTLTRFLLLLLHYQSKCGTCSFKRQSMKEKISESVIEVSTRLLSPSHQRKRTG